MRSKLRLEPSTAIATLALFVALGGTSYAISNSINGSLLKNRSVAGKKLMKHTVTGTEVNVSGFPKVPSAHLADAATNLTGNVKGSQITGAVASATNAANATNVGGHTFAQMSGSCAGNGAGNCATTAVKILNNFGGLTLGLRCEAGGNVDVDATSATANASYGSSSTSFGNLSNFAGSNGAFTSQTITNPNAQTAQMTFAYKRAVGVRTEVVTGALSVFPGATCSAFGHAEDSTQ
jgi:hypothetical protein